MDEDECDLNQWCRSRRVLSDSAENIPWDLQNYLNHKNAKSHQISYRISFHLARQMNKTTNLGSHTTCWENLSKIKKTPKISLRPFLPGGLHNISQTPNPEPMYNSGIGSPLHLFWLDTSKPRSHDFMVVSIQYSTLKAHSIIQKVSFIFYKMPSSLHWGNQVLSLMSHGRKRCFRYRSRNQILCKVWQNLWTSFRTLYSAIHQINLCDE